MQEGVWFRLGPKPFVHRPTKVLDPLAIVTRRPAFTTEAHGKKYETNPISSKPIAINELRFVLRPPPFLSALGRSCGRAGLGVGQKSTVPKRPIPPFHHSRNAVTRV